AAEGDLLKEDLSQLDQEASVVKFVNQIIWEAYQDRSTDIHLEPMETDLRIRYRIDGVLHQTPVPAQLKRFQAAIISRIKVMANMDIAEKRLPQDGRISLRIRGEEIDVRVSTMPTVYGESVSLRLLMRSSGLLGMDKLGLCEEDTAILTKLIHKPHGILLVTGPTGSGKSTSLYAWLHTINSIDKRILTIEDPIEYEMAGINQIHVKPEIGLTFAIGLRHILRQDPDVIMVGEIRDKETAEIAIRAALTGHLVFSTLHTNDAAGAITRLLDMGIEPFLVASSVEALIAQRLVRKLCHVCRKPWEVDQAFLDSVGFNRDRLKEGTIYTAAGCEECRMTGFRGRTGIYEILVVTDHIRPLIVARASSSTIKAEALRHGMHTLREDGWTKALNGTTTVEEILRVSEEDEALTET
ncbi:MAG: type II/IV secretion system protein, partial [Kiritimatiellae bacterium]|nr:type II/IV secretion system protein [Kiritimatiellia bacterium]